jgi:tetratricopeptide (TPR) repeat protein
MAGRDLYHIVPPAPDPARERLTTVSVEPPMGSLDVPLRGREALIAEIGASVNRRPPQPGAVHVLHGLGGCGKSRVALEVARQAQAAGRAVWWVSVTGPARISAGMREIAGRLGAPATQLDLAWSGRGRLPTDLVWDLLHASPSPWLLIFDNADDPDLLAPLGGRVADGNGWLRQPRTANGLVLVTTRDGNARTWGSWVARHPVRPLPPEAASQVLLDMTGGRAGTAAQARALAVRLGGLPLALCGAGRYLEQVTRVPALPGRPAIRSFDSYREALDRRSADPPVGSTAGELAERLGLRLVRESFGPSLDLLANRGRSYAITLLRLLACLADAPIPFAALLDPHRLSASPLFPTLGPDQVQEALDALSDFAFIDATVLDGVTDPAYANVRVLHPLMRDMARDHDYLRDRRAAFDALVMDLLHGAAAELDPDVPEHWSSWSVLGPQCAGTVLDYLTSARPAGREPATTRRALELVRLTVRYLLAVGLPRQGEIFLDRCRRAIDAQAVEVDEQQALALRHERGRTALEQGRLAEAERELREVIAARERLLGAGHPDTLASRHKLARAIMEQHRWDVAEAELRGVLAGEEQVRGPEHPDTLTIRHSLARAMLARGRAAEAERELRAVLDVRRSRSGDDHPETVGIRNSLARALLAQDRRPEAERELRTVLAGATPDRYRNRPELMTVRHTLAQLRRAQGDLAGAAAELRSLVEDRRRILGDTHPDTVEAEAELAELADAPTDDPADHEADDRADHGTDDPAGHGTDDPADPGTDDQPERRGGAA